RETLTGKNGGTMLFDPGQYRTVPVDVISQIEDHRWLCTGRKLIPVKTGTGAGCQLDLYPVVQFHPVVSRTGFFIFVPEGGSKGCFPDIFYLCRKVDFSYSRHD